MRIGELATATGVTVKTLRFYEQRGLLHQPERKPSGYRDYPGHAVDRVAFIRHAKHAGLTLRQIGEVLAIRDDGQAPCQHVSALVSERLLDVEQTLRELRRTRDELRDLRARLDMLDPTECQPATICSAVATA